MAQILVIDDEPAVATALVRSFRAAGHAVATAGTAAEGAARYWADRPDLVLLDFRLPDGSGFDVLDRVRDAEPVVIVMTGYADVALAVEAMQRGAENFLTKPLDGAHLAAAVNRALEKAELRRLNALLRNHQTASDRLLPGLLGPSPDMRELARQVELLAASDRTTALLVGETGTGKRRIAGALHAMSPRAARAFVVVSCAATAARRPDALEVELFGAEDGRRGAFELAAGGTVVLDEVAELPPELQPRLLEVLEHGTVRRRGSAATLPVDVRVIGTSSRDLVTEVNAGRFREDLYYRLSAVPIHLPPLRARARADLVALAAALLEELRRELPDAPSALEDDALDALLHHPWPGNIRELRNALERALLMSRGSERVRRVHLPREVQGGRTTAPDAHTPRTLADVERAHIDRTLQAHALNRTHAARELGISRATLIKKIREYGLAPATEGRPA